MRNVFIVLMILLALFIAAVAMLNNEIVTVHYLFGQLNLSLFLVILVSALAGLLFMVFFSIYRSIQNYIKAEGERGHKKELQRRVKALEGENKKLEDELVKFQKEREDAAARAQTELETEKRKLEEELDRQKKESENAAAQAQAELEAEKRKLEEELDRQKKESENAAAQEQAALEAEKRKLEEELIRQKKEHESLEAKNENGTPKKKGFWDFLKK